MGTIDSDDCFVSSTLLVAITDECGVVSAKCKE